MKISRPAATRKACTEPAGIMEQEAAYLAALPKAARYQAAGRSVELLSAEGTRVASFTRAPEP
jgi:heat shock protein HslJ